MQIYGYKLFSTISLDCNFTENNILKFINYVYGVELSVLQDRLKKYTIKQLQNIYDECISKSTITENLYKYNSSTSHNNCETRLGYQVAKSYITKIDDDKNPNKALYYFVFSWYELENFYIFLQNYFSDDFEKRTSICNTSIYTIPHDFMSLFSVGSVTYSKHHHKEEQEQDLIFGFEKGIETQKKETKKQQASGGKAKGEKYSRLKDFVKKEYPKLKKNHPTYSNSKIATLIKEMIEKEIPAQEISFFAKSNRQNQIRKWISESFS